MLTLVNWFFCVNLVRFVLSVYVQAESDGNVFNFNLGVTSNTAGTPVPKRSWKIKVNQMKRTNVALHSVNQFH